MEGQKVGDQIRSQEKDAQNKAPDKKIHQKMKENEDYRISHMED